MPRMEVGQGITTSTAMIIAEELDLPIEKVHVTLAPARPELMLNQLTGGSNTTVSTFTPIRVAAAIAKGALLEAAAIELGSAVALLKSKDGVITRARGASSDLRRAGGQGRRAARPGRWRSTSRTAASFEVIGKPANRIDARDIVTGKKKFAMDLDVPDALPTMVCRPPTHERHRPGRCATRPRSWRCPVSPTSRRSPPASRCAPRPSASASTRSARWTSTGTPAPVEGESDETILRRLRRAEVPLAVPKVPVPRQDRRGRLHLHVPQQRRARAVRRHRGRARRQADGLGRPQGRRSWPSRTSPRRWACRATRSPST